MNVQIRAHALKVSGAQRAAIKGRLALILGRFGDRVDRVIVRLSDGEGDRSGVDRCCCLDVGLQPGNVRVEVTDTDLFAAVDHAAHRAVRAVARALDREGWWDATSASIRKPGRGRR
jgi:ribosome-associated translation inhibitor RaiA